MSQQIDNVNKGIEMTNRNPGIQKYNNRNEEFRAEQRISTGERKTSLENRSVDIHSEVWKLKENKEHRTEPPRLVDCRQGHQYCHMIVPEGEERERSRKMLEEVAWTTPPQIWWGNIKLHTWGAQLTPNRTEVKESHERHDTNCWQKILKQKRKETNLVQGTFSKVNSLDI